MLNVTGLDGKVSKLDINPIRYPLRTEGACKSKFQYECGQFLKEKYPFDTILEEVYIDNHKFYLDFFLPKRKLVLECHGRQHDKYVPYFHKSAAGFKQSQNRDSDKKRWCENNGFQFLEVRSLDELRAFYE